MTPHFDPTSIRLIVGIGNPDSSYDNTYHNVGLLFVRTLLDALSSHDFIEQSSPSNSGVVLSHSPSLKKWVGMSTVYMNRSAKAVQSALSLSCVSPEHLLLVHDDSDIALGSHSFAFGRGPAGHNGVSSVQGVLHTKDFWRLRIGIRDKESSTQKAGDFVLQSISPTHQNILEETFQAIFQSTSLLGMDSTKQDQN